MAAEGTLRRIRPETDDRAAPLQRPAGLLTRERQQGRLVDIDLDDRDFQSRLSGGMADVRRSLERDGQQEPVDLTGKPPHRVIDGFRRVAAADALGWSSIKAIVHPGLSDREAFRIAFTKNVVRKNLSAAEKANARILAQQRGIRKAELAQAFGLSEKQVGRYLALASVAAESEFSERPPTSSVGPGFSGRARRVDGLDESAWRNAANRSLTEPSGPLASKVESPSLTLSKKFDVPYSERSR